MLWGPSDARRLAQWDLEHTVVRAVVSGVVGNRTVQAGQYVKPGSQLLMLVPLACSYVVANFKETQLGKLRRGQPVEVSVDAYPGVRWQGRVESFAPASGAEFALLPPENATGNFRKIVQRIPVRIELARAPEGIELRPGLSVVVRVDTREDGRRAAP
jgi:membrane fusion protein (multidrug efflux system)